VFLVPWLLFIYFSLTDACHGDVATIFESQCNFEDFVAVGNSGF
jgi:hypothetical protein